MITCREYIEELYNLLLGEDGEGYIGSKATMRDTLSLKLSCFIDKNYLNKTLSTFRDIDILGSTITGCSSKKINIGNYEYRGIMSLYPGIELPPDILFNKLNIAEEILTNSFNAKVLPVIKKEELKELQKLIKEKKELALNEIGYIPNDFFTKVYDEEYGIWIYDINPNDFNSERKKIIGYTKAFFDEYKLEKEIRNNKEKEKGEIEDKINRLYGNLIDKIEEYILNYIEKNDYLRITIEKSLRLSSYSSLNRKHIDEVGFLKVNKFEIKTDEEESTKLVFSNELGSISLEICYISIIECENNYYKVRIEGIANAIETDIFLDELQGIELIGIQNFIEKIEKMNNI